jgi:hypothetical protein
MNSREDKDIFSQYADRTVSSKPKKKEEDIYIRVEDESNAEFGHDFSEIVSILKVYESQIHRLKYSWALQAGEAGGDEPVHVAISGSSQERPVPIHFSNLEGYIGLYTAHRSDADGDIIYYVKPEYWEEFIHHVNVRDIESDITDYMVASDLTLDTIPFKN